MTLLVSSHILAELDEYSTHMLALNQGRVLEHRAMEIGFSGDASAQAALVRACVEAASPLTVVAPLTENLQQSYLKSLQTERSTARKAQS